MIEGDLIVIGTANGRIIDQVAEIGKIDNEVEVLLLGRQAFAFIFRSRDPGHGAVTDTLFDPLAFHPKPGVAL